MSLADDVALLAADRPARLRCTVAVALERLPAEDAADLVRLLDNDEVPGTLIARALLARGIGVKGQTIQRHRNGGCSCWPLVAA